MTSSISQRVSVLVDGGQIEEAAAILFGPPAETDAEALFTRGLWRVAGQYVARDLGAARRYFKRAAERGHREAAVLHAYFLACGTGGADDWSSALAELRKIAATLPDAARQIQMIDRMALGPDGNPTALPEPRQLSTSPFALAFEGFMSPAECAYLRSRGEARFQPSMVIDPRSGNLVPHPVRKSSGTVFGVFDEDLVVNALNRRIAAASGTALAQGEPLQLLRYAPGDEYRAHMDALANEPNQRILTMIVYLSDQFEGGDTHFLRTGLSYKGRMGDALLFRNVTPDGHADPMAEHAGRPVTRGVKLIASRWIRARPFVFPPPRPLLEGFFP